MTVVEDRNNGSNPADSGTNDDVNENGSGGDNDEWYSDGGWWADAFNYVSIGAGFISAGLGVASLVFPPFAVVGVPAAAIFGGIAMGAGALSTLFTSIEYGFTSGEFMWSAAGTALSLVTYGQSRWITPVAKRVAPAVK
ncbi:hypothetical protein [Streptomyces sp. NBC_00576]|uniref:hypothetical protein n=1 Tax=Streptomyces sp. NBC_00576 TaxID=2903665 RepID=UPI002E81B25E|nr:hypothetical protein [Streptomyces sp. NBC_00576]WUB70427.1 hypothetical protein OG734_10230 [Streptomyces sp. NBC_00576]